MQPGAARRQSLRSRPILIVAIVAIAVATIAMVAVLAQTLYLTTLQPQVALTNATYTTASCVPVYGGFGNQFNWTFALVNSGTAEGDASIQFFVDGFSLGYRAYTVPQHSQVTQKETVTGTIHASRSQCTGPETPALALASVRGGYSLDVPLIIGTLVRPTATIAFTGVLLSFLQYGARRRGFSIFADLGSSGWGIAILTVFAGGLFAAVLTQFLLTPYNIPVDWTVAILYGIAFSALGIAIFAVAYREMRLVEPPKPPTAK